MTESVPILMYHVVAETPSAATRRLSVTPRSLDEQIAFLVDQRLHRDDLLGPGRLRLRPVKPCLSGRWSSPSTTVTPISQAPPGQFSTLRFSGDGFRHERLDRRRWPNAAGAPLDKMLNWAQVRELAAAGIEIGAHSHSHPQLDQLADDTLCGELRVGRALLEDCVGAPVRALAYPFGYSSPRVRLAARAAGYRCAAAVRNIRATSSDDLFMLPRLTIRRSTNHMVFASAVTGGDKRVFRRDRLLTAGWASVRSARRARKRVLGNA